MIKDKILAGIYAQPPFGNDSGPVWAAIILLILALVMIFGK